MVYKFEAECWMGYLLVGHKDERSNCFSKNLLIGPIKDEKKMLKL